MPSVAVCRFGNYGDALWLSSVLPWLKERHDSVDVHTEARGEEVLRHDPNISRIVIAPECRTLKTVVAYAQEQTSRYDTFINLTGSVETRLLPLPFDLSFYLDPQVRKRVLDGNYLEMIHTYCGVLYEPRVRFYPTSEEYLRANARRPSGYVVVIHPSGSGFYKRWPHWPEVANALARDGKIVYVVGDVKPDAGAEWHRNVSVIGQSWPIRDVLAFAQLADLVIGVESVVVNAVSFEAMPKIVLLSHSSANNLTRGWRVTTALSAGADAPCQPCHRIHLESATCVQGSVPMTSACMSALTAERVLSAVWLCQ